MSSPAAKRSSTMDSETILVIASTIAGIAGGFISSWMAFNASGEAYNPRKHGNALITGALSGIGLGLAAAIAAPKDITEAQTAVMLLTIFLSSAGIDRLRSSGSKMTVRDDAAIPAVKTTTTTPEKEVPK